MLHHDNKQPLHDPFQDVDITIPEPFVVSSPNDSSDDSSSNTSTSSSSSDDPSNLGSPNEDIDDMDMFDDNASFLPSYVPMHTAEMDEKLHPACQLTILQAVATLMCWFSSFPGISKEAFSRLLFLLHTYTLPSGNLMPTSYSSALAMMSPLLMPVEDYHCCVNDCIVYRNSGTDMFKDLLECPVCGEPRFEPNSRTPRKRFKYLPMFPRLQRMFGHSVTSHLLQGHFGTAQSPRSTVATLHESHAWNSWYGKEGFFQGDPRGISLGLCMDGLNPFSKEKTTYSMWPMMVTVMSLPQHIRNKPGSIMLMGIIPGKNEPKDTDAYVRVLVDDILELNKCTIHDAFCGEDFQLKVEILMHHLDYPGQNKLFHCQGITIIGYVILLGHLRLGHCTLEILTEYSLCALNGRRFGVYLTFITTLPDLFKLITCSYLGLYPLRVKCVLETTLCQNIVHRVFRN